MDGEVIKYQKFFEHFLSSVNSADQLPVKIIVPTTTKAEVKGTVIDWILQYLYSWYEWLLILSKARLTFSV